MRVDFIDIHHADFSATPVDDDCVTQIIRLEVCVVSGKKLVRTYEEHYDDDGCSTHLGYSHWYQLDRTAAWVLEAVKKAEWINRQRNTA